MVRFFEDRLAVHEQLQAAFEEEQQGVRAHQQVLLAKFKDSKVPHRMTAEEMKEKVQARRYVAKKGETISSMVSSSPLLLFLLVLSPPWFGRWSCPVFPL